MEREPRNDAPGKPAGETRPQPPAAPEEAAEERLDDALTETFPTSDPVSISVPEKEREWTPEELADADRRKRQRKS
jgi:hypothetical protein